MKAIVAMDQATEAAGITLVERPEPTPAINDVVVEVHASGFVPAEWEWPSTWVDRAVISKGARRASSGPVGRWSRWSDLLRLARSTAWRSTSSSSPFRVSWWRSSTGCETGAFARTSEPSRRSTMPSPRSTRPSGAKARPSSACAPERLGLGQQPRHADCGSAAAGGVGCGGAAVPRHPASQLWPALSRRRRPPRGSTCPC